MHNANVWTIWIVKTIKYCETVFTELANGPIGNIYTQFIVVLTAYHKNGKCQNNVKNYNNLIYNNHILPSTEFLSVANTCFAFKNRTTDMYKITTTNRDHNNEKVNTLDLFAYFFIIVLVSLLADNQSSIAALIFLPSFFWLMVIHKYFTTAIIADTTTVKDSIFDPTFWLLQKRSIITKGSTIN